MPASSVRSRILLGATAAIAAWRGAIRPPFAAGLVLGGAIANVADRFTAGSVIDFISIGRWPIFNLADSMLIAGIVLLSLRGARKRDRTQVVCN